MSRESFLERVRQAASAGRAYRVPVGSIPPEAGYVGAGPDLCQALADKIRFVGGTPHVVSDLAQARSRLTQLLQEIGCQRAFCWRHELLDRVGLEDVLRSQSAARIDHDWLASLPATERRAAMLAADVGISSVSYAVAETGTLAVFSRPGQERLATLLPPIHIAVVERTQIVPDLFDLFQILGATPVDKLPVDKLPWDKLPSNIAFITGPSKTGDIELQLTTGVHGPGTWIVIIIR